MKLPGVYLLCLEKRFVYIGESKDVVTRLRIHRRGFKKRTRRFDEVLFLAMEDKGKRMHVERLLIQNCQPSMNQTSLKKCKVRRISYYELREQIKDLQSLDYEELLLLPPIKLSEILPNLD